MKREFLINLLIILSFLGLGFALLHFELIGYGVSFFVFLPFLLGYINGGSAIKAISFWALIAALSIFFFLLIFGELEGMLCVLMALPLVFASIGLGLLVKYLITRRGKSEKNNHTAGQSMVPLLCFLILGFTEKEYTQDSENIIEVRSEIALPYSSMQVYNTIKSVDTLNAQKPILMYLDLPVPHKCILHEEKVGGLRTCYFEGGRIVERITELEKGRLLRMDVIDYELTGRKWLGFKEAIYKFNETDTGSKMTRITTYTSELQPRFYWEPLERLGIEQEHLYVFRNLRKDLIRKYGLRN